MQDLLVDSMKSSAEESIRITQTPEHDSQVSYQLIYLNNYDLHQSITRSQIFGALTQPLTSLLHRVNSGVQFTLLLHLACVCSIPFLHKMSNVHQKCFSRNSLISSFFVEIMQYFIFSDFSTKYVSILLRVNERLFQFYQMRPCSMSMTLSHQTRTWTSEATACCFCILGNLHDFGTG